MHEEQPVLVKNIHVKTKYKQSPAEQVHKTNSTNRLQTGYIIISSLQSKSSQIIKEYKLKLLLFGI